jgi:hypothetical protein
MDTARNYPIPAPADDPRFNMGLAIDLAGVLEAHGFPALTGGDIVQMQMALHSLIYGSDETSRR